LVSYLAEIGVNAANNPSASWQDIIAAAGYQPMLIGGRAWCHWTGVRIWGGQVNQAASHLIALANPAPGYMSIHQVLEEPQFDPLGPFSAVWFASW
jgi:hypothetical protein